MRHEIKRVLIVIAGVLFIILGLFGFALPLLQGWLFTLIGIILLSIASHRIRAKVSQFTQPHPRIHALFEKTEKWIVRWIGSPDRQD